jgi:hypothetical protein
MVRQFEATKNISDDLLKNMDEMNFETAMKVGAVQSELHNL